MNNNAKKWIAALRSGKYKQGQRALKLERDGETFYCCLGVACELAEEDGMAMVLSQHNEGDGVTVTLFNGESGMLPPQVMHWLGMKSRSGDFVIPSKIRPLSRSLVELNDKGHSFESIAEIIEKEPEGMFAEGSN